MNSSLFADSGDGSEAEPATEEENKKIEEQYRRQPQPGLQGKEDSNNVLEERTNIVSERVCPARAAVTETIDLAADGAHHCQSSLIMTMIMAYFYPNTFII